MDLLILLVESRRQLVSRSDIVDRLWGKDVFVDVETGVNTAISKVRQALRDSPDAPAFVETVPGKGYRFIATVEAVAPADVPLGVPRVSSRARARERPAARTGVVRLQPSSTPTVSRPRRGRRQRDAGIAARSVIRAASCDRPAGSSRW